MRAPRSHGKIIVVRFVPVAQWIERWPPEPKAAVRVRTGAQTSDKCPIKHRQLSSLGSLVFSPGHQKRYSSRQRHCTSFVFNWKFSNHRGLTCIMQFTIPGIYQNMNTRLQFDQTPLYRGATPHLHFGAITSLLLVS